MGTGALGTKEVIHLTRERVILVPHMYVEQYRRWMRSVGRSETTIKQRTRMAERILERWPDPGKVEPNDIADWLGSMDENLTRWTRATYHGDVRAFFGWLAEAGHIHADPTDSKLVQRPQARAGLPKPLTAAEEFRALDHAHGNMRAWLLLALRAGLRASEIAAFRGEEIAEDYIVLIGKGSKEAAIPTSADLWEIAQDFPRRGWWFPSPAHGGHVSGNSVTILVGRHFRRPEVDIPKGSIHRCRHTFGTKLQRATHDLRKTQTLMRHSSPATTAIYTAMDEDDLRDAINMIGTHPPKPAA